jgi:hypothetical protein
LTVLAHYWTERWHAAAESNQANFLLPTFAILDRSLSKDLSAFCLALGSAMPAPNHHNCHGGLLLKTCSAFSGQATDNDITTGHFDNQRQERWNSCSHKVTVEGICCRSGRGCSSGILSTALNTSMPHRCQHRMTARREGTRTIDVIELADHSVACFLHGQGDLGLALLHRPGFLLGSEHLQCHRKCSRVITYAFHTIQGHA